MKVSMRAAVEWSRNNPILESDEIGVEAIRLEDDGSLLFEVDPTTGQAVAKFKNGDGISTWNARPYADRLLVISDQDEYFAIAEEAKTLASQARSEAESARGKVDKYVWDGTVAAARASDADIRHELTLYNLRLDTDSAAERLAWLEAAPKSLYWHNTIAAAQNACAAIQNTHTILASM
jgi:hypothetical protein